MTTPAYGPFTIRDLAASLDKLSQKDRDFAISLLSSAQRYGQPTVKQAHWLAVLLDRATSPQPVRETVNVGDLSGVIALFDRARKHLQHPAIRLQTEAGTVRLSVAGERARVPGSINVASDGSFEDRDWYGRVHRDGRYEPSRQAPAGVEKHLRRFAADPAGVAAEHGRLTGHCAFCNRALDDERSTAVGYGPICAGNYGLPWGARPAAFAEAAA